MHFDMHVKCGVTCRDLAVDLRIKMGDWFRAVRLLKSGGGAGGCGNGCGVVLSLLW